MVRTAFVSVVVLAASANAFLAPVPGYSLARTSRSSGALQMVTSPGVKKKPAAAKSSKPVNPNCFKIVGERKPIVMESREAYYTEALQKAESEALSDLEKAFDETAKKAKAESDKIWGELEAENAAALESSPLA